MSPGPLEYVNFRQATHLNYHRVNTNFGKLTTQAIKFVQQDLPTGVLGARDDPRSLLELGIRQWTGFGAARDKREALLKWTYLASHWADVSLSLKARAHASLAKGYFDLACENCPKIMQLDRLYDAGSCANKAVALGLISTVTLDVAEEIEEMGFRRPEDNKSPQYSTARFEELTDLWEALDARDAERAEENQKREAKVSKDPLGYFCAAEDCGIVVTKKSTLRRCAGECPSAFKPSYCSKDCQKTDWKHHRSSCKPDATESSVRQATSSSGTASERRPGPPEDTSSEESQPGPERTINVNFGGETIQIRSNAMGPQMMREMREGLEGIARESSQRLRPSRRGETRALTISRF